MLKERSPSCGSGAVYDGTFSGVLTEGWGITAALLRQQGLRVVGESGIATLLAAGESGIATLLAEDVR